MTPAPTSYRISYRTARYVRTIVSVVALVALTCAAIGYVGSISAVGRAVAEVQIIPVMVSGTLFWILLWAAITLIFGRIYCSTVCPVGTLTDFVARLGRVPAGKGKPVRVYRYAEAYNRLRLGVMVITLISMIVGIYTIASVMDPYSAYTRILKLLHLHVTSQALCCVHGIALAWLSVTVAALTLLTIIVLGLWRGRLICNTLCPVGTLLGLVSNHSVLRMEINTDLCTNCRACEYACKAQCINLNDHVVDSSRCVLCFDCTDVCPTEAMNYRSGRHTLSIPMMQTTGPSKSMQSTAASPCDKNISTKNTSAHNETISGPTQPHT